MFGLLRRIDDWKTPLVALMVESLIFVPLVMNSNALGMQSFYLSFLRIKFRNLEVAN